MQQLQTLVWLLVMEPIQLQSSEPPRLMVVEAQNEEEPKEVEADRIHNLQQTNQVVKCIRDLDLQQVLLDLVAKS